MPSTDHSRPALPRKPLSRRINSEIELVTKEKQVKEDIINANTSSTKEGSTTKFTRSASVDLVTPIGFNKQKLATNLSTITEIKQPSYPVRREAPKVRPPSPVKQEAIKVKPPSPVKREAPKVRPPSPVKREAPKVRPSSPVKRDAPKVRSVERKRDTKSNSSRRVDVENVKIDPSRIGVEKANAYNELMQQSRTFQIIPKSARKPAPKTKTNNILPSTVVDDIQLPCTDIDQMLDSPPLQQVEDKLPDVVSTPVIPKLQPAKVEKEKYPTKSQPVDTSSSSSASSEDEASIPPQVAAPAPAKFRPQIQSASAMFGTKPTRSSGFSFTVDPSKYKSAAPPIDSQKGKSRPTSQTRTIVPTVRRQPAPTDENNIKKNGKRKPTVEQIKVVGGYVQLSRSLLKTTNGKKKKSVRFSIDSKQFKPGEGFDPNSNNNNNKQKFLNRTGMYIPSRGEIKNVHQFTEIKLDPPNEQVVSEPPALPPKKKIVQEKFVSYIDDHDLDKKWSSSCSSSDDSDNETHHVVPTSSHDADFFSDVTTNDLLF